MSHSESLFKQPGRYKPSKISEASVFGKGKRIVREIKASAIVEAVRRLCVEANRELPPDLERIIREAGQWETSELGKKCVLRFMRQHGRCT